MSEKFPEKVFHGGIVKRIREKTGQKLIDFSANINPMPPHLEIDFGAIDFGCYPDDEYVMLKEAISDLFSRPVDEITVGNGSIELIRVFCNAVLRAGDHVMIQDPTFGEYRMSARLAGASPGPSMDSSRAAFICNPNNPTGHLIQRSDLMSTLDSCERSGTQLFIDEAFIELSDTDETMAGTSRKGLFVLRSLTKSFAVPGIRFGYGFGDPDLIKKMETIRPPWSVNVIAEQFALSAFRHYGQLEKSRRFIRREREWLCRQLGSLDVKYFPSSTNFLLLDMEKDVTDLCLRMASSGILIRDCHSFGLPDCIRIAVRTRDENKKLIEALAACVR